MRDPQTEPRRTTTLATPIHDDGAVIALDRQSRLRSCLEALDETKRRSVLMAYISGYTHGEIAGRLGVPLGTAKAWVRRGLVALRECMG